MILQKPCQCEGWQKRSPKDLPMWGMAEAFSKRPANVRDGRSVLQKTADVRDQLILYLYLLPMPMTTYYWLLLLQAIHYYPASLLTINYCHTEPYTTNCDNCFDTERPTTPSGQQLSSTTALPPKTLIHAETRLIFAIDHYFTHCPRAYCKKLQHQYIEQKRERYIEIKIMFWEFEEEIPSHCSYTERSKL